MANLAKMDFSPENHITNKSHNVTFETVLQFLATHQYSLYLAKMLASSCIKLKIPRRTRCMALGPKFIIYKTYKVKSLELKKTEELQLKISQIVF